MSESAFGRRCLNWDWFTNHWGPSQGLAGHNHCRYILRCQCRTQIMERGVVCLILFHLIGRNPNHSLMPWCNVRRGMKIVKEFCNIPRCKSDVGFKIMNNCTYAVRISSMASVFCPCTGSTPPAAVDTGRVLFSAHIISISWLPSPVPH